MSFKSIATVTLSSLLATAAFAADQKPMDKPAIEKCSGVAKAGKNDCAAGAHSCAGQATQDFDKTSYVAVPAGVCGKLAGGTLTAMTK